VSSASSPPPPTWSSPARAATASGDTNAVISEKLGIGKRGVERHLSSIFGKLELDDPETVSRRVVAALVYREQR